MSFSSVDTFIFFMQIQFKLRNIGLYFNVIKPYDFIVYYNSVSAFKKKIRIPTPEKSVCVIVRCPPTYLVVPLANINQDIIFLFSSLLLFFKK